MVNRVSLITRTQFRSLTRDEQLWGGSLMTSTPQFFRLCSAGKNYVQFLVIAKYCTFEFQVN